MSSPRLNFHNYLKIFLKLSFSQDPNKGTHFIWLLCLLMSLLVYRFPTSLSFFSL